MSEVISYLTRNFLNLEAILSIIFIILASGLFWAAAKYTPGDRNGR